VTMWVQMKLNPPPPDPAQKIVFDWMPVIFTFMLANFSAGLVIYWAWNNTLSVTQQGIIMRRNGVKIELWDNISASLSKFRGLPGRLKALGSDLGTTLPVMGKALKSRLKGQADAFKDLLSKIKPPKL